MVCEAADVAAAVATVDAVLCLVIVISFITLTVYSFIYPLSTGILEKFQVFTVIFLKTNCPHVKQVFFQI